MFAENSKPSDEKLGQGMSKKSAIARGTTSTLPKFVRVGRETYVCTTAKWPQGFETKDAWCACMRSQRLVAKTQGYAAGMAEE